MHTFKAQAKSNAKRFLVQTAKVDNFEDYLTQHEGSWGCWLDADGKPVPAHMLPSTTETDPAASVGNVMQPVAEPAPCPQAAAFVSFALSQLTAEPAPAPAPAAEEEAKPAARAGATSTTGLKIEKDREERNGVVRQSKGSVGDQLWALYDSIGKDCTLLQAKAMAEAHGLSVTSAAIALYRWRKFHGYVIAK